MSASITAIIPAYNEAERIEATILAVRGLPAVGQTIIVDDGSKDSTCSILEKIKGIEVIRNQKNRGKGYSVGRALKHAENSIVLLIDADLGETAAEAEKMISAFQSSGSIMVIGALPSPSVKGGIGIVKSLSRNSFYMLTAREVPTLLSGQRLMPADFIRSFELPERFGLELALTLEAARRGLEIVEIPVNMQHRETTNTIQGFWHRGRQCADILRVVRSEYRNMKQ